MKLRVLRQFRDKDNHEKIYKPGDVFETQDESRANDLVARGLATSPVPSQGWRTVAEQHPAEEEPSSGTAEGAEDPAEKPGSKGGKKNK